MSGPPSERFSIGGGKSSAYPELREHYVLQETLGAGGFAKVKAGIHKLTGEKVAIKIMDKELLGHDLPRAYREIKVLKKLQHQHICQMFQVIESETMIYLIVEFCSGGELFDYIVAKERLKEKEARAFFRQIVSAIKYIHEAGYVHRDLKPENLLLDEDSNIKLIDFGLVSEPDINVTQLDSTVLLETCCGSPAYAAPELIRGGPYVGPRADIWSLGVLLYALLNGFLPFDDDHTPRLYQLIQKGDFEIPDWLTPGSVGIISRLLQTNPLERISVDSLLQDSWITKGYSGAVDWKSRVTVTELDERCVEEMARHWGISFELMTAKIQEWCYNEITATYFLLVQKKNRGYEPTIIGEPLTSRSSQSSAGDPAYSSPLTHFSKVANPAASVSDDRVEDPPVFSPPAQPAGRARRISLGQPIHPPVGELLTLQKADKVVIHPAITAIRDEEGYVRPVAPAKKNLTPPQSAAGASSISGTILDFKQDLPVVKSKVTKTRSYDARLQFAATSDADDDRSAAADKPSPKSRRKRLGSLEIIYNKVKTIARRKPSDGLATGPRKVKGVYDISTTSRKDSQEVLQELERVLEQYAVRFMREGYVIKCFTTSDKASTNHKGKPMEIRFELEVCLLPRLEMLGVRRKRIRGDVWEFKRICDLLFKATHL